MIYFKQLVNSKKVIVSTKQTKNGRTCWNEEGREAENKVEGSDGKVGNNSGPGAKKVHCNILYGNSLRVLLKLVKFR